MIRDDAGKLKESVLKGRIPDWSKYEKFTLSVPEDIKFETLLENYTRGDGVKKDGPSE